MADTNSFIPMMTMNRKNLRAGTALVLAALFCGSCNSGQAETPHGAGAKPASTLLNVSYDPTRELYHEFNAAFASHCRQTHNQEVSINQSQGCAGSQGRAVIDG